IPEGVEEIDGWTAADGVQVSFPSTLKRIGELWGNFRGELRLPEGLESYGNIPGYFTGNFYLPESIKVLGHTGGKFSGGLVIPQGLKMVSEDAFKDCKFTGTLELPEGIEHINGSAFRFCGFIGELVLPKSLRELEAYAFSANKFTTIIWPDDLAVIGEYAFSDCNRLQGTITIPSRVRSIEEGTFSGCSLITGIELPEDVEYIGREAFAGCERLTNISCKADVPPFVCSSAFNGVGLDHVILEVPAVSVNAYRTAPGWKEFKRITPYKDFSCYPSQIQALNQQKIQTVTISTNGEWKLGTHPDWCSVSPSNGKGKTQVMVTVEDLSVGADNRNGKVEFEFSDNSAVIAVEVAQYDYQHGEDTAVKLQQHTAGNGIPIYFIGDGWNGDEIASGKYLQQCKEDMEYFFGIAPYDRLRNYFDVYSIMSLSQESGVNTVYTYRDTKFSTIYTGGVASASCGGSNSQLLPDESLIFDYLKNDVEGISITDNDLRRGLTILIPNATDYSSVTYYYDRDFTISICPPTTNPYPMDNRGVVQHEACGHGFGKLGDELISKNQFAPAWATSHIESMHEKQWFMNLATTGNMNTVPWSHMIFDPRYSDRVDVFEGGYGFTRSVFRSESNSCMNLGIPYFNSISRQYITKRILETAGEGFDLDSFFENDTFAWGNTAQTRSMESEDVTGIPDHKAPVMMSANESRNLIKNARNQQKNNIKK
ncbi:MAG: leucine-rich repeat protein, partial [Muribaculaceae bacterium]|nr:leucine-rich repeat protein [Muribaculaceae bacterium]